MNTIKSVLAAVLLAAFAVPAHSTGSVYISSTQYHAGASGTLSVRPGESFAYSLSGTWVGLALLQYSQNGSDNWQTLVSSGGLSGRGNSGGTVSGVYEPASAGNYRWFGSSWTSGGFVFSLNDRDDFVQEVINKKGQQALVINDDTITTPNALTVSSNATVSGTLAVTGAVTQSGLLTVSSITVTNLATLKNATLTAGTITVSTSATSGGSLCLAGTFQSLPASGYAKGCFAYQLSNDTPYISTEAVSNAGSWKALY